MQYESILSRDPVALDEKAIGIVQASAPAVAAHAEEITTRFYSLMFAGNPEVRPFFNAAHQHSGGQQRALAGAICAYAANIRNLEALKPAIKTIAHKHCSLGVQPEHYPIVGKHLLVAVKDVLGDAVTDEVAAAWGEAYEFLADVIIRREAEIYRDQAAAAGGWNGYRPLTVRRKQPESEIITSFYLGADDGLPLPTFRAGQYITVRIDHPETPTSPRNYSLSDRPGLDYYRISVKREPAESPGAPDGLISNYLHDRVEEGARIEVGPPCGDFTLDLDEVGDEPVTLLSAGVGATPLLAMLRTLAHNGSRSPTRFLHATRNSRAHAFAEEVRQACAGRPEVIARVLYDEPLPGDIEQGRCDGVGRIDLDFLQKTLPDNSGWFYVCGPKPFMAGVLADLRAWGVPDSRIRFEFFGPKQELN